MYGLAYPWILTLLPAPFLIWWLLPPYRERKESVRIPFFDQIAKLSGRKPSPGAVVIRKNILQMLIAPLVWGLVVTALARPQFVEPPIERVESARDLLLAVDLSGSMEARDFTDAEGNRIDRLEAVKLVLDDFIARRQGDRIGLVVFGDSAHLQVPFTLDHEICRELLDQTQIRMVGPRTAIGEAIGLAIKLFEASDAEDRVLILLTDGDDTGSKVPPPKAAEIAAQRDITIHTVGIGDPETGGDDVVDVANLRAIAAATGGSSYLAVNQAELEGIYRELDLVEEQELTTLSYRPRRELFLYPLGAGISLVLFYHLVMFLASLIRGRVVSHA
jgi:Ca-activated chloride channel family protein